MIDGFAWRAWAKLRTESTPWALGQWRLLVVSSRYLCCITFTCLLSTPPAALAAHLLFTAKIEPQYSHHAAPPSADDSHFTACFYC